MHVVRTAWVYGATGRNFVKTIAALASTRDRLQVVDDQHGAPTWAAELARGLVLLGERPAGSVNPGVWHLTGAGSTTWCGFARAVVTLLGHDPAVVEPVPTTAFPRPAPRPAYAVLDMTRWRRSGLPMPPPWEVSLAAALPGVVAAG
jgi:dTDP-4-dehydrorhamnose reductase